MSICTVEFLKHIRDEALFLQQATAKLNVEEFIDDEVLKRACIRAIEVIGEAGKKIPEDFRAKYPEIEWRKMSDMRNRLIHNYFGVDYYIVFDVARNKSTQLAAQMNQIIQKETTSC